MQYRKLFFHILLPSLCFCLVLVTGCNKPAEISLPNEGEIYMPQAAGTRNKLNVRLADTIQPFVFGAARGGMKKPETSVAVTFKIDSGLIASYNQMNGTSFVLLPANSYTISGFNTTIASGQTSSDPLILGVNSKRIAANGKYLLPITIANVSGGVVNQNLKTTYFIIDTVMRKSVDVTLQGVLTVSNENAGGAGAGEGSPKVVDGDINTKYLFSGFTPNTAWMQLQFAAPVAVGAYTLGSANDAATRDPKDWRLAGSNDGTTWTTIDTRVNEAFAGRLQTRRFEIGGIPQAYTHYRFYIDQNGGSSLFQLAEWRLIRYE